ncbi:MAG: N-acetylmuramoyl-L-alanine amidase [Clostridia bacterium]
MNILQNISWWKNKPKIENEWSNLKPIDLIKIQSIDFPKEHYFQEEFTKTQIVLHHTISGAGIEGDLSTWEASKDRVSVAFIIDRAGTPWQLFSSKFWAYHLAANNHDLDRHSIGIEIDNWGGLITGDGTIKMFGNPPKPVKTEMGKFYAYYGNPVAVPLQYYPNGFRGYNYYEKYSRDQIQTVGELILYWKNKYNILIEYHDDMWNTSRNALDGAPGIWTHVSYRLPSDKQDCHPAPDLINMLKTLKDL